MILGNRILSWGDPRGLGLSSIKPWGYKTAKQDPSYRELKRKLRAKLSKDRHPTRVTPAESSPEAGIKEYDRIRLKVRYLMRRNSPRVLWVAPDDNRAPLLVACRTEPTTGIPGIVVGHVHCTHRTSIHLMKVDTCSGWRNKAEVW